MRNRIGSLLFVALCLFLINPISFANAEDVFKIGCYCPLTGPVAEVGHYMKNGSILAQEEINAAGGILGKKLEMVFADDESKVEVGVSAFERLINKDGVDMVVGGYHSSIAVAVQVAAAKYGKICYNTGAVIETLEDRVRQEPEKYWFHFKGCPSFKVMGPSYRSLLNGLAEKGSFVPKNKTTACILEDSDYGRDVADSFIEALKKDGWTNLAYETVKADQADYIAQIAKLRALKPEVVMTVQASPAASASLCKSFREAGIPAFFLVTYVPFNPEYLKLTGNASETIVFNSPSNWVGEYANKFKERYRKRFNEEPGMNAGIQYDGIMHTYEAIKLANSTDQRKVADAMLKIQVESNCGVHRFDPVTHTSISGDDLRPVVYYQIVGGKFVSIYPDKYKEAAYVPQKWLR